MAEALEGTAAAAAAGATEAAAGAALSGAVRAMERAVEVVMGAAAVGATEGAASPRAEAAGDPPACRSSKLLPARPTGEPWSRGGLLLFPFLPPSDLLSLPFPDGSQQFLQ